jgi:hypothetical protein
LACEPVCSLANGPLGGRKTLPSVPLHSTRSKEENLSLAWLRLFPRF